MTNTGRLVNLLRNTPVREIIRALERDGLVVARNTRTGGLVYSHPDGRNTFTHYHTGGEALVRKLWRPCCAAFNGPNMTCGGSG